LSPIVPWRVLASEHLRRDRWISLRADRCVTAEGVEVAPYYVLEYPDWVHVVAIGADRRVLLVEQYRHGAAAVTLEVPAGRMDPADGSPLEAARRELLEETGCAGSELALVGASSPNPASHDNQVHTVLATGVAAIQAPLEDPRERLQTRWVSREEAFGLALRGALPALQAASLFTAYHALGWLSLMP
jgi:8-oxo-dGTP pyrophosphatase MutT (NUDIX family)